MTAEERRKPKLYHRDGHSYKRENTELMEVKTTEPYRMMREQATSGNTAETNYRWRERK